MAGERWEIFSNCNISKRINWISGFVFEEVKGFFSLVASLDLIQVIKQSMSARRKKSTHDLSDVKFES